MSGHSGAAILAEQARPGPRPAPRSSERARAEAALAASEERFRLLAERGKDIVYRLRTSPDLTLEYVSPATTRLIGYTPEELYADRSLWMRLVHPDDRSKVNFSSLVSAHVEEPVAVRWICRDGSIVWTEHRSVPVVDPNGRVVAIEGVARDVTRSVEAERRVRASEARFRELLASIDLSALMLDESGRVEFINDHLLGLLGRPRDEVQGADWISVAVPEREQADLRQVFRDAIAAGTGTGKRENGIVTASGAERRLIWTSVIQRDADNHVCGIAGIAHDVTDVHLLVAERKLLAAAVEQMAEAIIVTDPEANIVFVNPAFERVSGYSRKEVLGKNPRLLSTGAAGGAAFGKMWAKLRAGKTWQGELSNRRKDGTEYTESATISPVLDAAGELNAYVSVQRDVTHIREVEADLVLEARVRALLGDAIQAAAATSTPEEAAQAVCEGLASLPGIDVAYLVAFLDTNEAVIVASRPSDGLPLRVGDRLPQDSANYLHDRAAAGPWGTRQTVEAEAEMGDSMRDASIRALAFGPIQHGDHIAGVLVVGTRDERHATAVADKMPPLVSFGASANTPLVERMHARRREHSLRGAIGSMLAARAFRPVFQPIVELSSNETMGYEALTRFDSGERPERQFADAWAVGIGPELELATLEAAIEAARGLPAGRWLDLNMSPRLLDSWDQLHALIRSADRPIVIEITEHERIADYANVRNAVTALGKNVRLAVDDAGVGIANFGHIVELRPDFVKLDTSLVRGVNSNLGRQALVVAMRHFARTAGCRLVAEGVETVEEARALAQLGVEFAQGYWFGRPENVENWTI
jgi:PAS domain S-box-containing protein